MAHRYRRSTILDPEDPEYRPPHRHPMYPRKDPSGQYCVSYFPAQLFLCILEELLMKMGILSKIKNDYQVTKVMSEIKQLLAKKFSVAESKLVTAGDELDAVDPHDLHNMLHKLNKLENDRKFLIKVVTDLFMDLYIDHRYKTLVEAVKAAIREDDYRQDLKEEESRNKIQRREVYKQLRQQRNHFKTVIYDSDGTIEDLKSQLEDLMLTEAIRSRYVCNWQQARSEQHAQTISDKEYEHASVAELYKKRTEQELQIHSDVDVLINVQINDTLREVENWMNKYDKDLDDIDLRIQLKKIDYQNMKEKRVNLEETIANHKQEMEDWVSFKDERERARLYREKMTKSAVTVQAWWRGLLVRRQLGPYKVRKSRRPAGAPPVKRK